MENSIWITIESWTPRRSQSPICQSMSSRILQDSWGTIIDSSFAKCASRFETQWTPIVPTYKRIEVSAHRELIILEYDGKVKFEYYNMSYYEGGSGPPTKYRILAPSPMGDINGKSDFLTVAVDDLASILGHPKLRLENFTILNMGNQKFMKKLNLKLKNSMKKSSRIHSDRVTLCCEDPIWEVRFLRNFHAGSLKNVNFGMGNRNSNPRTIQKMNEINEMRVCRGAEMVTFDMDLMRTDGKMLIPKSIGLPRFRLIYNHNWIVEKAWKILCALLKSETLQICRVDSIVKWNLDKIEKNLVSMGVKKVPNSSNFWILQVPGAKFEFFEIELITGGGGWGTTVEITRKIR